MGLEELLNEAKFEGKTRKDIDFIESLIKSTGFSKAKIAQLAGADEDFVSKVILLIGNNRFTTGLEYHLLEEAKKEGRHEMSISIATEMRSENISYDQIARYTKLPIEEIEEL